MTKRFQRCHPCGGTGRVGTPSTNAIGSLAWGYITCRACNGKGKVPS